MEIIKRAKGNSGEIVQFGTATEADIRDEIHRRSAKAGHTNRNGEPLRRTKIMAKQSTEQYRKNYVRIFGHD